MGSVEHTLQNSVSIIDMSDSDDLGNMFEKLVSRHSKFTREFDKNMEICVTHLKKLSENNSSKTINLVNSLYNVDLKAADLENLKETYELCPVCKTTRHAPLNFDHPTPPMRKSTSQRMVDYMEFVRPLKNSNSRRFFFDFRHSIVDSPRPQEIKKEASRRFTHQGISDYFVFLVNQIETRRSGLFRKFSINTVKGIWTRFFDFFMNVFPLFHITNFTNLIIVLQWFLLLFRVLIYRRFTTVIDIEVESIKFGAFSGNLLKDKMDVHRVITSTFFHNSFAHLIVSTMMHLRFSAVFEKLNGIIVTVLVYLTSSAYGMIGVCWLTPSTMQASGFAGDWGVAGALLSRFFLFPYLIHREFHNVTNVIVSYICLFFLKTIGKGSSIVVSAHLLSCIAGLCMGTMINIRSKTNKITGHKRLMIDFVCSATLLVVPIFSVFMLFLGKMGK
ncbi:uncharacterized protein TOT_010000344 [Theileria orientalis strain Shintoku]|uniref:Peptidase S54 rhomboid domain-containing protein n=1 Tax=Theileria orientalis strain Shintoku TaxID=869250 RepID=J4CC70_THEOR|nr:uncharacterized protein TOT_010000344 [Theileria orientalis strain Shintoku]PVC52367.1 hypothetical protein MACL_00000808 [Theileria orientalis]BAM38877.1 uncharacterized protein TOT_010000344 [Theileria orientalis strain Shintoku]|eukprot:XP_009689178.1 uncharacterized protein TOT_010000344 [Theileria orientalis strain Shintoku]